MARNSELLIPVYLRREPTREKDAPSYKGRKAFDVVLYRTPLAAEMYAASARWIWSASNKPRKGSRIVRFNCWDWRIIWLADKVEAAEEEVF